MREAYLVAVLRRADSKAPYQMVRIDIFSEPAWQLTETGDGVMYAQLAPCYPGETYADAREHLEKIAAMYFPRLAHLFAWTR